MSRANGRSPFFRTVNTLVWRDLLSEYRSREILGGGIVFALLTLVVFNFAIDLRLESAEEVAPGILWIGFAFAGMLAFGRSFAAERERGTLDGLLLAPIDRGAIYLARAITNAILMCIVELVSLPVFVALYNVRAAWGELLLTTALGTIGFTSAGTLVAAIAANTRAREIMLPVLLLPLTVPVLIASVKATAVALGAQSVEPLPWLQLLLAFDVIMVATSFLVFEYILDE
ncbi:MAG TPA: heme exporter protein CcmB [Chloroflexota bacterium]|nr:heme exporter protein CcmB [Chloroflexota bacterium]